MWFNINWTREFCLCYCFCLYFNPVRFCIFCVYIFRKEPPQKKPLKFETVKICCMYKISMFSVCFILFYIYKIIKRLWYITPKWIKDVRTFCIPNTYILYKSILFDFGRLNFFKENLPRHKSIFYCRYIF